MRTTTSTFTANMAANMDRDIMASKRQKKFNFSEKENSVLLEMVKERYGVITHTEKTAQICRRKKAAWIEIVDAVNSVGCMARSLESVQKRWKDMKTMVKNKPKRAMQTGGGPPDPPVPFEDVILSILNGSSVVNGIVPEEEGDTFACLKVNEVQDVDDGQAFGGPFQTTTMGTTTMGTTTMAPVNGATAELNEDCIEVVFGDVTLPSMKPPARSGPSTAELTTILMQQAAAPEAPARDRASSVTHSPRQPAAPGTTARKQKPARENLDDDLFNKYLESEIKKNTLSCELFGQKKRINASKERINALQERKLELEVAALEAAALERQKKQPPGTM